jgi:deazaflavin-dependent oxidoreductase (nitroreductase family)
MRRVRATVVGDVPLPRSLARFNRVVTNRIARRFAGRLPGFAIVVHRGRRSGRTHRTPVNAFRRPGGWVFALTYGPGAEWVRNVLAAGGCELIAGGRVHRLAVPRVVRDPGRRLVPAAVRPVLRLANVDHFLELDESAAEPLPGPPEEAAGR